MKFVCKRVGLKETFFHKMDSVSFRVYTFVGNSSHLVLCFSLLESLGESCNGDDAKKIIKIYIFFKSIVHQKINLIHEMKRLWNLIETFISQTE